MKVKITTECVWDKKRHGVGSVIEVPVEVVEKNPFMKATDEPLKEVQPAGKDKASTPATAAAITDGN